MLKLLLTVFFVFGLETKITPFEVEKYELDNGLEVLLHQDKSLPIYTLHLWYNVGSRHEDPNRTGLAHFFEHLMFKGTKKYPEGVYDKLIEQYGGQNNAFTTRDYTGYYVEMPSGTLKKVLELEADRMVNLDLTLKTINTEREVVKEERRLRVDNSPFGTLYEKVFDVSYAKGPYQWSVIGSMEHLNKATLEEFFSFYKQHYAPNNAVLVIAGDFNKNKAKAWIKKYFEKIPSQSLEGVNSLKKNIYSKVKSVHRVKFGNKNSLFAFVFPGASAQSKDIYALDLITVILSGGSSSQFYVNLVDQKKLLSNIQGSNYTPFLEGLIMYFGTAREKVSSKKIEEGFEDFIKSRKFTQEELDSAKKKLLLESIDQFKTISGKANALALNEIMFNDYTRLFTDIEKYNGVTLKEIQTVFKKYYDLKKIKIIEVGKK